MNSRLIALAMVLAAAIVVITPSANAESGDPPRIGFDFNNGFSANESVNLSGIIEFDSAPDSVFWSINSDSKTTDGSLSSSLQELESLSDRTTWSWNMEFNIEDYPVCTCYITIGVNVGELTWSETRVLFIGDTLRSGLILDSPKMGDWTHNSVEVRGWSFHPTVWASPEIRFFSSPSTSSADSCISEGNSDTSLLLSVINTQGDFLSSLDTSSLSDGWHSLYVENYDPSGVAFTQDCVPIRVNNALPEIILSVEEQYMEKPGEIMFDASASDDSYWGREDLEYTWILRKPSHSGQTPVDIKLQGSTYSVPSDSGGSYSLTLSIKDSGGVSSTAEFPFEIVNIVPTAIATLDNLVLVDGDQIKLSKGDVWFLDASDSTDSANDIANLRCVWMIDYEPVYEGCQRELSWPSEAGDEIILTLEVIDDDEDYERISVLLTHPDANEPLPYPIIVLVASALFMLSAIFLRYRSDDDASEIPSWDSTSDK